MHAISTQSILIQNKSAKAKRTQSNSNHQIQLNLFYRNHLQFNAIHVQFNSIHIDAIPRRYSWIRLNSKQFYALQFNSKQLTCKPIEDSAIEINSSQLFSLPKSIQFNPIQYKWIQANWISITFRSKLIEFNSWWIETNSIQSDAIR